MKTRAIGLLFATFAMAVQAQDRQITPFVEEGKTWYCLFSNPEAPELSPDYTYSYCIKGDTLIDGKAGKKRYVYNRGNNGLEEYKTSLREEEGIVYFAPLGKGKWCTFYNFNVSSGDTFQLESYPRGEWTYEMGVDEEVTLTLCGQARRCLRVHREWSSPSVEDESGWWIEGVGSQMELFNTWVFNGGGNSDYFQRCEVNGVVIFDRLELQKLSTGIKGMETIKQPAVGIYDLEGRRLPAEPRAGQVYIKEGRKQVGR